MMPSVMLPPAELMKQQPAKVAPFTGESATVAPSGTRLPRASCTSWMLTVTGMITESSGSELTDEAISASAGPTRVMVPVPMAD